MPNWSTARTVVEEKAVSDAVDRFSKRYRRFAEAYEALKWLLARRCEHLPAGMRTVGGVTYHLYRQAPDRLAGTPAIIVVYTYDHKEVVLIDLKADRPVAPIEDE